MLDSAVGLNGSYVLPHNGITTIAANIVAKDVKVYLFFLFFYSRCFMYWWKYVKFFYRPRCFEWWLFIKAFLKDVKHLCDLGFWFPRHFPVYSSKAHLYHMFRKFSSKKKIEWIKHLSPVMNVTKMLLLCSGGDE